MRLKVVAGHREYSLALQEDPEPVERVVDGAEKHSTVRERQAFVRRFSLSKSYAVMWHSASVWEILLPDRSYA